MICLDSNVAITVMNAVTPSIKERLMRAARDGTVLLPTIVLFELRFGIANSGNIAKNQRKLDVLLGTIPMKRIEFDDDDAAEAGEIRAYLRREGTPIGPYDVLIAAQARRRGAVLVTANTREFSRVPGLLLQDWSRE